MAYAPHPLWDSFSTAELEASRRAVAALRVHPSARSQLDRMRQRGSLPEQIEERGDLTPANLSDLFEARFAAELLGVSRPWSYEFSAGVGTSTVDFRIEGPRHWLIELVSLRATGAVKDNTVATETPGGGTSYSHLLQSGSGNSHHGWEHEMLAATSKILQKAVEDGKPTKFPPVADAVHAIVVDIRGYAGDGHAPDEHLVQIAAGAGALHGDERLLALAVPGTRRPIRGVFDPGNPVPGASLFRERLHFVGFVLEERYDAGEIPRSLWFVNNMSLLATMGEIDAALRTCPFQPIRARPVLPPRQRCGSEA